MRYDIYVYIYIYVIRRLKVKEQEKRLTLNEHDDDDDDEIYSVLKYLSLNDDNFVSNGHQIRNKKILT